VEPPVRLIILDAIEESAGKNMEAVHEKVGGGSTHQEQFDRTRPLAESEEQNSLALWIYETGRLPVPFRSNCKWAIKCRVKAKKKGGG